MQNNLLFFISHQPNPRFIKQINYLADEFNVSVIYLNRSTLANLNHNIDKRVKLYEIANIIDGNYLHRIGIYLKSIKKLHLLLLQINPTHIIINNIDILFFLLLAGYKKESAQITLEISDLKKYTFSINLISKLLRYLDKLVLDKYIQKLIVTSPKFYDFYFSHKFHGPVFVLENKPLKTMMPPNIPKQYNDKLTIGIVGLLLDGKPHKTLFEYAITHNNIEIVIYGKGHYEEQAKFYSDHYENIHYFGAYDFFKDISSIYASIDILYMPYDTTNNDLNINFALPNKLYEAMYFQVPVITSKNTYLFERVQALDIGYGVNCCVTEDIENVLNNFKTHREEFQTAFSCIDKDLYLADTDYLKLKGFIVL